MSKHRNTDTDLSTFERHESGVRTYCRSFPVIFDRAVGSEMFDRSGCPYIDFLAGAGALNYGHNNPELKSALVDYITRDGITHGLDLATDAKEKFLQTLVSTVLEPRNLEYKVMFPGPTGTNAVEAALKLVRKVTGRTNIISFTNAFHGMTLGALSLTGNSMKREGAGLGLGGVTTLPFDGYLGEGVDTLDYLQALLNDGSSGLDKPAAFIVETIQAEGGINEASISWLRRLERLANENDILFIVDDIQVGCGRTGPFFSFEDAGLDPDVVCLSKSLSGFGLPLSVVLFRPELDVWQPGEHNGTFRGNNHAFVTATAALELYWKDDAFTRDVASKAATVSSTLAELAATHGGEHRGRGLIQGLAFENRNVASAISRACFERGLVIETAGPDDEVLKLLPSLTIDVPMLVSGLDIIAESMSEVFADTEESEPIRKAS
ncbi:MAG: diaminobutyrate-2-oxoglutarate transaminase [Hyphomicrobiaceae bacterium]|jgi:diaminobutyrate-2-oxoglutarate transaminase